MIPVINHLLCLELFGVKSRIHLSINPTTSRSSGWDPPPPQPRRRGGKLCHIHSETSRTRTNWNLEASLQISCDSAERGNPEVAAGQEASERGRTCPVGPFGSEWRAKGSAAPLLCSSAWRLLALQFIWERISDEFNCPTLCERRKKPQVNALTEQERRV